MITRHTPQQEILKLGESCQQCGHCCSFSSGFLLEKDIEQIANHLNIKKEKFIEKYTQPQIMFNKKVHKIRTKKRLNKPYGPCVFLKNKRCAIHEAKPLHCRVGTCSTKGVEIAEWFALNHLVDENDPNSVKEWMQTLESKEKIIPGSRIGEKDGKNKKS